MKKITLNVRGKIITLFLSAMLVALTVIGSVSAISISKSNTEDELKALESISRIQEARVDAFISAQINGVKSITSRTKLRNILDNYNQSNNQDDADTIKGIIKDAKESIADYKSISILDRNGTFVACTGEGKNVDAEEHKILFELSKVSEHIHFKKLDDGTSEIIAHGPIKLNNELIGVGIIKIESTSIINITKDYTGLGETGETVIAQWKDDETLEFLHERRFENNNSVSTASINSGIPMVDALKGIEVVTIDSDDYRGERVFSSTRKIDLTNWGLVVKKDYSEISVPVGNYMWNLVYMFLGSMVIISLMAYYFSKIVKSRFNQLEDGIKILESGKLDYKINIEKMDEIGLISKSFNNMAFNLKQAREKVDKQVVQQTKDIDNQKKSLEDQQLAIMNILEDVEEEKQGAEKAANELKKFQMAVAGASDHIVITDPEGIVLYANEAVTKITGFLQSEVIGKKAGDKNLWGGLMDLDFYKKLWKTIKVEKNIFAGEINNKRKNGEEYVALASISPITDEMENVLFFVGIERDITKEKQVDQAKTEFVSLASHQLRTPLSAINWYAEMLLNKDAGDINDEQEGYLKEIYKGNQRMVDLVNSLLNVSRLELGTFEIKPEMVGLKEVGKDVIKELNPSIKIKRQNVIEKYSNKIPKAKVDKKLTRMIIQNLLSNAVKYTPNRGTITLDISYSTKGYKIKVSDTGYGIPKNQHNRVFSKLFRADNVRAMDTEGTGLGLYIIKSILDHSDGKISFTSAKNKGTTFIVEIPKSGMKQKEGSKTLD